MGLHIYGDESGLVGSRHFLIDHLKVRLNITDFRRQCAVLRHRPGPSTQSLFRPIRQLL